MNHPKEQILVIPTILAESLCNHQVFGPTSPVLEKIILDNHSFRDREEAEQNFAFKQVIPYIMVVHGENYLLTQRTKAQQEKRLHDKFSIGQGGHINELDMQAPGSAIAAGMLRELREEFHLGTVVECVPLGLINDNSSEVGRVHLALPYRLTLDSAKFHVAERGKHIARWATAKELEEHYEKMEDWSKRLVEHVVRAA